jgi:hypothetical protein
MRKKYSYLGGLTAVIATLSVAPMAHADPVNGQTYAVELNKTEVVRLPMAASAVVIGNPSIADVSVHAADTLFVVGRGYGETNLIVLGPDGSTMMDADIQVLQKASTHGVRVFNRSSRQSYNCAPQCQPSPVLGDDPTFIGNFTASEAPIQSSEAFAATSGSSFAGSADSSGTSRGPSEATGQFPN